MRRFFLVAVLCLWVAQVGYAQGVERVCIYVDQSKPMKNAFDDGLFTLQKLFTEERYASTAMRVFFFDSRIFDLLN